MKYYYTYYSYEDWGRGYIGCRPSGCECTPEEDPYLGSFKDKTFNPTNKIVLGVYATPEECLEAEIKLHNFFEVDVNPHFANKAKQTSVGFSYDSTGIKRSEKTIEKIKSGHSRPLLGKKKFTDGKNDFFAEECPPGCKPGIGSKHRQNRSKIPTISLQQGGLSVKNTAWWNNGKEQRRSMNSPGEGWVEGRLGITVTHLQELWICLETGHTSTAGGLSRWQTSRGIDTSKRKRLEFTPGKQPL